MAKSKSGQKNYASLLLRIGLGLVFAYAAVGSYRHPQAWVGYLPGFIANSSHALLALKFFTFYELVLAVWLFTGYYLKYAAIVTALTLVGIVLVNHRALDITFRDIGLIFSALALLALNWDN